MVDTARSSAASSTASSTAATTRRSSRVSPPRGVPVWNGLTDVDHPTQALADILTLMENTKKPLNKCKLVFCGDTRNNVAYCLMYICAKLGMHYVGWGPKELAPAADVVEYCREVAKETGAVVEYGEDKALLKGADALYTDIWASMGEEDKIPERVKQLTPYKVTGDVMKATENSDCIFLHCLPSFHDFDTTMAASQKELGYDIREVTDEVFLSPNSKVFDEAENACTRSRPSWSRRSATCNCCKNDKKNGTPSVPILFHFLLFKLGPVAGLAQLGPLFILGVRLELVVVAVRRFLNGEVVPGVRVRVVRPDRHVREKIVLGLGLAVEDAVDERHGLGTGDVALGTKRAVGIARDPAVVVGDADLVLGPVGRDIAELRGRLVAVRVEAGGNGGELGAGDGGVRAERAVGITRDDAHGAQGRDRGVVPVGARHVGVAVGLGQVLVADASVSRRKKMVRPRRG